MDWRSSLRGCFEWMECAEICVRALMNSFELFNEESRRKQRTNLEFWKKGLPSHAGPALGCTKIRREDEDFKGFLGLLITIMTRSSCL